MTKEIEKYYWAKLYKTGEWEPVQYYLVYKNKPCFYRTGNSFASYSEDYPDFEWGEELSHD